MKKVSLLISFIVFSLFVITSCETGNNTDNTDGNKDTTEVGDEVEVVVDKRFNSVEGKFKVMFPGEAQPEGVAADADTDLGHITTVTFTAVLESGAISQLAYYDISDDFIGNKTPEEFLKAEQTGFSEAMGGLEIKKEEANELDANKGLYYEGEGDNEGKPFYVAAQYYLKGNRVYKLFIMSEEKASTQEEKDAYFGTFAFTE